RRPRPEEEERRDPDQGGIEPIEPGMDLGFVELEDPCRRRADRRADDRAERHQPRAHGNPQREERPGQGVLLEEDLSDTPKGPEHRIRDISSESRKVHGHRFIDSCHEPRSPVEAELPWGGNSTDLRSATWTAPCPFSTWDSAPSPDAAD